MRIFQGLARGALLRVLPSGALLRGRVRGALMEPQDTRAAVVHHPALKGMIHGLHTSPDPKSEQQVNAISRLPPTTLRRATPASSTPPVTPPVTLPVTLNTTTQDHYHPTPLTYTMTLHYATPTRIHTHYTLNTTPSTHHSTPFLYPPLQHHTSSITAHQ